VTATCVGKFRRNSRSRSTVSRRCLTFFKARSPENHMLIMNSERHQDDVPTCVNAYALIRLAHSETHCSISSRIVACVDAGWMFLKTSASFANSKVSSITLNDVRTLSSCRNRCTEVCQQAKKKGVNAPYHPTRQGPYLGNNGELSPCQAGTLRGGN
jgi:hypothetical protein